MKTYKAYTPGMRHRNTIDFSNLCKTKPEKSLTRYFHRVKGRNNKGRITCRHKGGGHKRLHREIAFKRKNLSIPGIIKSVEYDPNRSANIALVYYVDGSKSYILCPENLNVGDVVNNYSTDVGSVTTLKDAPLGSEIHNIELLPGRGGQIVRSAGSFAKILAKEGNYVAIKLPSKEVRLFHFNCLCTFGRVGNAEHYSLKLGKAGRNRWLGVRPSVRGSAMNPVDHPHGGGEGKSPIGKPRPLTPWGKPALGAKTRNKSKKSNALILRIE